jgi:predicted dehydrogenase/RimJ/RimL family protein N-acetyltransferase
MVVSVPSSPQHGAPVRVGLVGAAGRGGNFRAAFEVCGARITAICDLRREELDAWPDQTAEKYTSYEAMLDQARLDAVVIGTPQHLHARQAVAALQRGLHVMSEVPAAVGLDEARELVRVAAASRGIYMLAENYCYWRNNRLVEELVRQGKFGELYYAHSAYLHDVRHLIPQTPWRRHWQMGIDGNTYPTHCLGPVLRCFAGQRITRVSCAGSGKHHRDGEGKLFHEDTTVTLCKTDRDALIDLRLSLVSPSPYETHYHYQGTEGSCEDDRLWLRELSEEPKWFKIDDLLKDRGFAERYLPEDWLNPPREALEAGHGGGDFFEVRDFVRAVRGEMPSPIDIHAAMDMTLPGLISQQSILRGGEWMWVPDSRAWLKPNEFQLEMIWPESRLGKAPEVKLPADYRLRQLEERDAEAFGGLMKEAGFGDWPRERIAAHRRGVLPGGFFVIEHKPTGELVATANANHQPLERHPEGGELSFVVASPKHAGRGLGRAVTAAVVRRFLAAGYRRIYLKTDDHRLPAIRVYEQVGFEPLLFADGMPARWATVNKQMQQKS